MFQLEHILVQIQVREIITDSKLNEPTKIAIKRIGVMVTPVSYLFFCYIYIDFSGEIEFI